MSKPHSFAENTTIPVIDWRDAQVGDLVFCHSTNVFGKAIRLGQYFEGFDPQYRVWNHIAWIDRPVEKNGELVDWYVGQAIAHGVDDSHLLSTIAPGGKFEVVPMSAFPTVLNQPINRDVVIEVLRAAVGTSYGYVTIGAEIFDILTPKFINIDFRSPNTWICSGLAAYALLSGGAAIGPVDIYQAFPAYIAKLAAD